VTAETVDAFDLLPAEAASDAVRAVEDAIDATSDYRGPSGYYACGCRTTGVDSAPAVVRALLDLGWRPPTASTPLGDIADT